MAQEVAQHVLRLLGQPARVVVVPGVGTDLGSGGVRHGAEHALSSRADQDRADAANRIQGSCDCQKKITERTGTAKPGWGARGGAEGESASGHGLVTRSGGRGGG